MTLPDQTPPTAPPPPPATAWPPPPPPPRRRAGGRRTVAALAIGAVLGVGLAVPATWAAVDLATPDQPAAGSRTPADGSGGGSADADPWSGGRGEVVPGGLTSGSYEDATEKESTGVVLIDVAADNAEGAGTGWVLDSSGLVVTNYHVVAGTEQVKVTDPGSGKQYDATVVGHDEAHDVALLRVQGADDLTTAPLDDDDEPAVGDDVTAVGNAQGQGFLSASDGTVSALDRQITTSDELTGTTHDLRGLIETDAYVVGGFSGGVLLDDEGEVVGMTTAASSGGPADSYAVPVDVALDVAEQIEDGQESGSVVVGPNAYLGIGLDGRTDDLGVVQVTKGGPAASAGIVAGDRITALDGTIVRDYQHLRAVLADHEPGDRVVLRWTDADGAGHRATVTLSSSPVN